MKTIRRSTERGHADHGWLESRHTFSFASYNDPAHMGFGPLRVINEDRVAPGQGFGEHGHRDMEILSWVLDGALAHKDSLGNGAVITPGELQRMTAGTGVRHSEFNASGELPVHFLQIWVIPASAGLAPGYEQRAFADADLQNRWRLVASGTPRDGALAIHQDLDLRIARLQAGQALNYVTREHRRLWLHLARGQVRVDGEVLDSGDAIAWTGVEGFDLRAETDAEVLLFDMSR
jgi:redox-sensitive bicupin YhaK (pirin superfamily)